MRDDFANLGAVFVERFEFRFGAVAFGAHSGRGETVGHIGVFGVGDDEVVAAPVGEDAREFSVERFLHNEPVFINNGVVLSESTLRSFR